MQPSGTDPKAPLAAYWSLSPDQLLKTLRASASGLSQKDAEARLLESGPNSIQESERTGALNLFLNQFRSPLVLILIFAASVSLVVSEWVDASIVLAVVFGSTLFGFVQEYRAGNAVAHLRSRITIKSNVMRDGLARTIEAAKVAPGDVVLLSAGSLIPADGVVLEAHDFFVNQAVLTGETFPVEKRPAPVPGDASLAERSNCVFMGTSVGSGSATVLIAQTGRATVFGQIAQRLSLRPEET